MGCYLGKAPAWKHRLFMTSYFHVGTRSFAKLILNYIYINIAKRLVLCGFEG